jgi:hypothetical protein
MLAHLILLDFITRTILGEEYRSLSSSTNKEFHTPRITDYKHTRKDRRIKREMAFSHTKKAIKRNRSKIIQLQATRKKINWTT